MVMVKYNTNFMGLPHLFSIATSVPSKWLKIWTLVSRLNGSFHGSQFYIPTVVRMCFYDFRYSNATFVTSIKKWGQTPWVLGLLKRIYNELLSSLTFQREIFNWNSSSKVRVSNIKPLRSPSGKTVSFLGLLWFSNKLERLYWR